MQFAFTAFLAKELFEKNAVSYSNWVWLPFGVSSIAFIVAVLFLIRSLHGYHYQLMPTPDVLESYREEIREKYVNINPEHAVVWTKEAYEEYIFTMYIEYTSQNVKNNDAKSINLNRCISSLIISFFSIVAAYVPYFLVLYI